MEESRCPPGVVRSPLQPEEVRGLTRSGELSRMLPSEMALMAHGWPRKAGDSTDDGGEAEEYLLPGGGCGCVGAAAVWGLLLLLCGGCCYVTSAMRGGRQGGGDACAAIAGWQV